MCQHTNHQREHQRPDCSEDTPQGSGFICLKRGWFKELDKSIKSASHALYPSRVEAWIDHFGVGVVAAIAVLAIRYIVETVRNFL